MTYQPLLEAITKSKSICQYEKQYRNNIPDPARRQVKVAEMDHVIKTLTYCFEELVDLESKFD